MNNSTFCSKRRRELFTSLFSEKNIVALGEVTHGSHEIFKIKIQLIKKLVRKYKFNIIAIEAGFVEAYKINNFTLFGQGSADSVVKDLHYRFYYTEEFVDFVKWVRKYNKGTHTPKILFYGLDMQYFQQPLEEIKKIISIYSDSSAEYSVHLLENELKKLHLYRNQKYKCEFTQPVTRNDSFFNYTLNRLRYFSAHKIPDVGTREWFVQNLGLIDQFSRQFSNQPSYHFRDSCMAENFAWIYENHGDDKFIIWAHNAHIQKRYFYNTLGQYLHTKHQDKYLSIGFAFYRGRYNVRTANGIRSHEAQTASADSYESYFATVPKKKFLLNMQALNVRSSCYTWLTNNHFFREIGGVEVQNEFEFVNLPKRFDGIIFFKKSTASHLK